MWKRLPYAEKATEIIKLGKSTEKCRMDKHNDVGVNCAEYLLVKNIYQQVKILKKAVDF